MTVRGLLVQVLQYGGNEIRWASAMPTVVQVFRLRAGVPTWAAPFATQQGDTLMVRSEGPWVEITLPGSYATAQDLANALNPRLRTIGCYAVVDSADRVYLCHPRFIEIVGGTALTALGLTAGTVASPATREYLNTVSADPSEGEEYAVFEDPNAIAGDRYVVRDLSGESLAVAPGNYMKAVCSCEGTLLGPDTQPLAGIEVFLAGHPTYQQFAYEDTRLRAQTDALGRFAFILDRGVEAGIVIPRLDISLSFAVPEAPWLDLNTLSQWPRIGFAGINDR